MGAMPAIASKTEAFFKAKSKFRVRYSTFGFQPDASLDDGEMWPTEFAVTELTPAVEARIAAEAARRAAMEAVTATAETLKATLDNMKVVEEMRRTLRDIVAVNRLDSSSS